MGTVKPDILGDVSFSMRDGVAVRAQRKFIVTEMTPTWDTPEIMMEALSTIGIPCNGAELEGFPDLVVTEINPSIIDKDKCEVIVVYENKYSANAQYFKTEDYSLIGGDISEPFVGEMDANIQMVDTNEYDEYAGLQKKTLIKVSCTYSATNAAINGVSYAGKTIEQVGTIQIPSVQKTWRGSGIIILGSTRAAQELVDKMEGKANYLEGWLDGKAYQWLCTSAKYKILGRAQNLDSGAFEENKFAFSLSLEFQFNPNRSLDGAATGWNPEVVFIDDRNNKPPIKTDGETELVSGTGYKTIPYFYGAPADTACDFKSLIGECV